MRKLLSQRFAVADLLLDWHQTENYDTEPDSFAFVTGHRTFREVRRFADRPRVLVFLRDPLERALSAYFYYRGHSEQEIEFFSRHMLPELFEQRMRFLRRARELSVTEFLSREEELARLWLGNVQTRVMAGATDGQPQPLPDNELLASARKNLSDCDVIGLTERMEESMESLRLTMDWNHPLESCHLNRTPDRPRREAVDPAAIEILNAWNRLDVELYEQGANLFDRQQERLRRSQSEQRTASVAYPSARNYRFDQPIIGQGWHLREPQQERWLCWTGERHEATLNLRLETTGPHRLECRLEHVLSQTVLDDLLLYLDDHHLSWQLIRRDQERWLSAPVPESLIPESPRRVLLKFVVQHPVRPSDVNPDAGDDRWLGIALSHIRLQPECEFPDRFATKRSRLSRFIPW